MGLPLQVRRELFTSVGQTQTFSKTNQVTGKKPDESPKNSFRKIQLNTKKLAEARKGFARFGLHTAIIAGVVLAVGIGKVNSQTSSLNSKIDQTSLITTAATLSEGSQNLLADDVTQKAKDISSQTTLTTVGDEFLAKRQPVMTAGAVSKEIVAYTVKEGDTLSSLSQKFNITSDTIKWANDISNEDSIKPGTKLNILPVSGILYTAVGNDDISAIANQYQANAALIDSYNNLEGKAPSTGQKLIIPEGVKSSPAAAPTPTTTAVATAGPTITASSAIPFIGGRPGSGNNYAYGYCTWYVANKRYIPPSMGNAYSWPYSARRLGMTVSGSPRAGAAGVARRGNHVVYIERVEGGTVYYTEMNGPAGWGRVNSGSAPAGNFTYIY